MKRPSLPTKKITELKNAVRYRTYKIIYTPVTNKAVGYILWAEISEESREQLLNHNLDLEYFYEWFEGSVCYLKDVSIVDEWSHLLYSSLKSIIRTKSELVYIRDGHSYYWKISEGMRHKQLMKRSSKY